MTFEAVRRASFVSAVVTTFGTYVAAASLSLVNLFIVARSLGASGRGDLVFLITVAGLTGTLGGLSIQEANANIAGSEPDARPRLATNSIILSVVLGAGASAIVCALVVAFPAVGGEVDRPLLLVALAAVPLVALKLYLNFLVQADYHFAVTNVAWLVGPVTTVAINGVLAAVGGLSVATAITAWIAGQALGIAILLRYIARTAGFGRPDFALAKRSVTFGTKAHLGRTMVVGHYRVDQWLVGSMAGSRELGLYSVATAWAEVLSYLPGVIVLVQRPDLVRAARDEAARLAARVFRVTLILTAPAVMLFVIAAPVLCVTLLGADFRGSVDDLRVLALAAFGVVALELLGSALTAQRKPILATAAVAVAFAATVILNSLLVPHWGGLGAAAAAAIASTIGGIAIALIFARSLGARPADMVPRGRDVPWLLRKVRRRLVGSGSPAEESGA